MLNPINVTTNIATMIVFSIFFLAICFLFGLYFYTQGEMNYKLGNITNITNVAAMEAKKANKIAVIASNRNEKQLLIMICKLK